MSGYKKVARVTVNFDMTTGVPTPGGIPTPVSFTRIKEARAYAETARESARAVGFDPADCVKIEEF